MGKRGRKSVQGLPAGIHYDKRGFFLATLPGAHATTWRKRYPGRSLPRHRAPTLDDAVEIQRQLIAELKAGHDPQADNPRVAKYVEEWIDGRKTITESTRKRHMQALNHQIKPLRIGRLRLQELDKRHIKEWINALERQPSQNDPTRMLNPHSIRNAYATLRAALNEAVADGLIAANPCHKVELPKAEDTVAPLTLEEVHALLNTVCMSDNGHPHRLAALYHIAVKLGLRQSEILGLRWVDIDFKARVLRVTGQQKRSGRARGKTKKAHRTLPLTDDLIALLRDHRRNQGEERRLMGEHFNQADLVFVSEVGTPMGQRNLDRNYKMFQVRAGLTKPCTHCKGTGRKGTRIVRNRERPAPCPECAGHGGIAKYRFHDLRHTYATLALAAGVDLFTLSRRMGHSSITVTADRYGHLYQGKADDADAIETYLKRV